MDLIIFDCDGVIVDSEVLADSVNAEIMLAYMDSIWDVEQFVGCFRGWADQHIAKFLTEKYDYQFPDNLHRIIVEGVDERLRSELKPIRGMPEVIRKIGLNKAVASNSPIRRLRNSIHRAGLTDVFTGRVYSADQVGNAKPAPDIFLHTAEFFNTSPHKCIVVEDSVRGVQAGVNAGMHVIGFVGGDHCIKGDEDKLKSAGAKSVATDSDDLYRLLQQLTPLKGKVNQI